MSAKDTCRVTFSFSEWFLVGVSVIAALLLIWSIWTHTSYCTYGYGATPEHVDNLIRKEVARISLSESVARARQPGDSALSDMQRQMQLMSERQDELVNDMRQETNNNLVRLDTHFSIWIGIIALLGVILPLFIQFRAHNEFKERLAEVHEAYESKTCELERKLKISENKLVVFNLLHDMNCIRTNVEYNTEIEHNIEIINDLLACSISSLTKIGGYVFKREYTTDDKMMLTDSLILTSGMLETLHRRIHPRRPRELDFANTKLKTLINTCYQANAGNWKNLETEFNGMLRILSNLKLKQR